MFDFRSSRLAVIASVIAPTAFAGPYSEHSDDPTNGFDAPIAADDSRFVGWASSVIDYSPAPGVTNSGASINTDPTHALGPAGNETSADGASLRTVSLGDLDSSQISNGVAPGSITLGFNQAITNGIGADFAVFENGFEGSFGLPENFVFAELAYVEVSSNGNDFVRFDSISLNGEDDLDNLFSTAGTRDFAVLDPTNVYNLAGKHLADWGTPFDLDELADAAAVTSGLVDLDNISFVRLVDIPGDGTSLDSAGEPIFDVWVTAGSGGLDLDAIGVINQVPEPSSLILLATLSGLALRRRIGTS